MNAGFQPCQYTSLKHPTARGDSRCSVQSVKTIISSLTDLTHHHFRRTHFEVGEARISTKTGFRKSRAFAMIFISAGSMLY